jgi:hypothetical protein
MITSFSNPKLNWRLRYSAATAIDVSGLLSTSFISTNDIELLFVSIVSAWFTLMQDSDTDVRLSAAKARLEAGCIHPVSELAAAQVFDSYKVLHQPELVLQTLFRLLDKLTLNVYTKLEQVKNEFHAEEDYHNVGTSRPIFEEEEPNSYIEICYLAQLIARNIVSYSPNDSSRANFTSRQCDILVQRCLQCLSLLNDCYSLFVKQANAVDAITRKNDVFTGLHSLFLGTACAIFCRNNANEGPYQELANAIMQIKIKMEKDVPHPEIDKLIETISLLTLDNSGGGNLITNCCFLFRCD